MLTALIDTPASHLQKSSKKTAHAANLAPADRKDLAVAVLTRTEPVTRLADQHGQGTHHQRRAAVRCDSRRSTR